MKFEFEEFDTVEEDFLSTCFVHRSMNRSCPLISTKGYIFSLVQFIPLSGDVLMMIYTKGRLDPGLLEFNIPTKYGP